MNHDDEELGFAHGNEEELGFAPDFTEEKRIIAPDFSLDTNLRLIPVICSACKTRLYATEEQIGMWKICPVCERMNEIRYVEPKFRYVVEFDENGGYNVHGPEIEERPRARHGVDYRTENEDGEPEIIEPRVFADQQPKMESLLQDMLDSKEEKERKRKDKDLLRKIEEDIQLHRKKRDTLSGEDVVARRIAEKEIAAKGPMQPLTQSPSPDSSKRSQSRSSQSSKPVSQKTSSRLPKPPAPPHSVPVPLKRSDSGREDPNQSLRNQNRVQGTVLERPKPVVSEKRTVPGENFADDHEEKTPFWPGLGNFLSPFLSSTNRKKMIVLFIFGFFANLCLEKVKSIIGSSALGTHPEGPDHVLTWSEMGILSGSFFIGVFFGIVWFLLVLMFGINILIATSEGKIKVKNWVQFDLSLGCSYFFWILLLFNISFYPGVFTIWGIDAIFPGFQSVDYVYLRLGIFCSSSLLTFPVLLLSITETDTFFGGWPRKTLGSLVILPGLWLKFYGAVAAFSLLPFLFTGILAWLNLAYYESPIMQSSLYYIVVALISAVLYGYFPLIYFRFLGRVSWVISQDYPELEEEDDEERE